MWLCGAYVALAPYPLTVVVVVQDSKPKTSSYYTHSSFNLKHRKSWWSSSTGSTMSPTTLSPATPSQVYWKKTKKTEQWFCFWVFVSTRKGLLIFFFLCCISAMFRKEWDFLSLAGSYGETGKETDDGERQRDENCLPSDEHSSW